jgi:DNA repair photolyase
LLEVFLKHRHPVSLITKNSLIIRDLDILQQLSKHNLVSVAISINTINDDVRRKLEPRTSTIDKRLQTAKTLVQAGIPITVLAAPIIPGLNDFDIIPLVKKVAAIGVKRLHHIVVRLNGDVSEIFTDWLQKTYPDREQKITSKIKSLHGGQVNDSRTGVRMRGEGVIADIIKQQFSLAKKLYGVTGSEFVHDLHHYKAPKAMQLSLF